MRDINLTLSTSEANNHIGQVVIRQDDDNTQKIIADITENGKPKSLAGLTVFFNAMIDNTIIARDLATIEDSSKVSYVLKSAFYQREGRIKAFFTFERGNRRESTADFVYFVTRGTCRNIKQGNYIYEFENLKGVVGDIIGSGDLLPLIKKIDEVQGSVDTYRTETNNKMSTLETKTNNKITTVEKDLSQKIDKHEKRVDNPHKVTASQTGAYDKQETKDIVLKNNVKRKYIYNKDAGTYLDEKEKYKYGLTENQEFVGVKLVFSGYNRKENVTLPYGYRSFLFGPEDVYGGAHYLPFIGLGGDTGFKEVKITSEGVEGTENNSTHERATGYVLRRVVVYYRDNI